MKDFDRISHDPQQAASGAQAAARVPRARGGHPLDDLAGPPGPVGQHEGRAVLAGTLAVAVALGGSRWASHIGVPPIYLLDVLLAGAVLRLVIAGRSALRPDAQHGWWRGPCGALVLLFGYVLLRFSMGELSVVAARDAAPYLYVVAAFLGAAAVAAADPAKRKRTMRLLDGALLFHVGWCLIMDVLPGLALVMPSLPGDAGVKLFQLQAGNDGPILGVTAALYLVRFLRDARIANLLVALTSFALVMSMNSRGALIASVVVVFLAFVLNLKIPVAHNARRPRRAAVIALFSVLLAAFVCLLPATTAGSKLLASTGVIAATDQTQMTGLGTKRAREGAWSAVIEYVDHRHAEKTGVGFGPNYMIDSGAIMRMVSHEAEDIRSPHSFPVNTYARLGLVGLGFYFLLLVVFTRRVWSLRRSAASDDLVLLAMLVPVGICIAALFSPLLEGPFGAIPFFWFLGVALTARPAGEGTAVRRPTARVLATALRIDRCRTADGRTAGSDLPMEDGARFARCERPACSDGLRLDDVSAYLESPDGLSGR